MGMKKLFACFGPPKTHDDAPRHRRRHRRSRRHTHEHHKGPAGSGATTPNGHPSPGVQHGLRASENGLSAQHSAEFVDAADYEDFMSCRDDFSVTDGSVMGDFHSLPASPRNSNQLPHTGLPGQHHTPVNGVRLSPQYHIQQDEQQALLQPASESESDMGASDQATGPFVGCLQILDNLTIGPNRDAHSSGGKSGHISHRNSRKSVDDELKPEAGFSMQPRNTSMSALDVSYCYEDASNSRFKIRSSGYMKTKQKIESCKPIYELLTADIFATDKKASHIARLVQLPKTGPPVMAGDVAIPSLLIFNLQLPLYPGTAAVRWVPVPSNGGSGSGDSSHPDVWKQAGLFGPYDGEGVSIVFYFKLPSDFDPAKFENENALSLFKRFLVNGREADGTPTRDRLKLIPRVVNVQEWSEKGPLSTAETKLLTTYNDKPILSRPQHTFYQGRTYFEVDLDLHQYTFLARRAIGTFLTRLPHVVWENAFVVQGNSPEELPEHLLGIARIYRFDFTKAKPLPAPTRSSTADGTPTHDVAATAGVPAAIPIVTNNGVATKVVPVAVAAAT